MFRAAVLGLALVARLAVAAEPLPLPAAPVRHVTDGGSLLSAQAAATLDARLDGYERTSGHQVLVWIGDSLGGAALDDWSVRTFAKWKVGRKGIDDGLVLFIFAQDRKIDIEVGYGLEDRVTDARAKQIIEDVMAPLLRAGKPDDAVSAGVDAVLQTIEGHAVTTTAPAPAVRPSRGPDKSRLVFYGVLGVIFLIFFITNPRLATYFLLNILAGGRAGGFGGGGGGGGGFSGGGGSSGGGGARGGW